MPALSKVLDIVIVSVCMFLTYSPACSEYLNAFTLQSYDEGLRSHPRSLSPPPSPASSIAPSEGSHSDTSSDAGSDLVASVDTIRSTVNEFLQGVGYKWPDYSQSRAAKIEAGLRKEVCSWGLDIPGWDAIVVPSAAMALMSYDNQPDDIQAYVSPQLHVASNN